MNPGGGGANVEAQGGFQAARRGRTGHGNLRPSWLPSSGPAPSPPNPLPCARSSSPPPLVLPFKSKTEQGREPSCRSIESHTSPADCGEIRKTNSDMAHLGVAVLALLVAAAALAWLPAPASGGGGADFGGGLEALMVVPSGRNKCNGAVGECGVDEDEELGLGAGGDALLRRSMAQRQPTNRYISYAALRANQVPCNKRGKSYYTNCASQQKANPYRRGCSAITRCQRNTN